MLIVGMGVIIMQGTAFIPPDRKPYSARFVSGVRFTNMDLL